MTTVPTTPRHCLDRLPLNGGSKAVCLRIVERPRQVWQSSEGLNNSHKNPLKKRLTNSDRSHPQSTVNPISP